MGEVTLTKNKQSGNINAVIEEGIWGHGMGGINPPH